MHYLCGCGKLCIAVAFLAAAAGFGLAVDGLFAVAVHRDSYRFIDSLAYALDIEVTLIWKRIVAGIDKIEGVDIDWPEDFDFAEKILETYKH